MLVSNWGLKEVFVALRVVCDPNGTESDFRKESPRWI